MDTHNAGYVSIIVQSFAAFLGLSVLLGRMYYLAYSETIGVPASSIRLSVIDYSIIAPDVTVLGIGIVAAAVVWQFVILGGHLPRVEHFDKGRVVIGSVAFVVGNALILAALVLTATLHPVAFILPSGSFGIIMAIGALHLWLGSLVAFSGLYTIASDSGSSEDGDTAPLADEKSALPRTAFISRLLEGIRSIPSLFSFPIGRSLARIVMLLIFSVVILCIAMTLFSYSSFLGRFEARKQFVQAPNARIEFAPTIQVVSGIPECVSRQKECYFAIVYVTDNYTFARAVDPQDSIEDRKTIALLGGQKTYAFPNRAIANIVFSSEPKQ